ncbi:MAG: hypothetical protein IMZ67_09170, partial [Acidobacteria bacterium]|nr:hypothetical protein [Acidobacteriota bacterium]
MTDDLPFTRRKPAHRTGDVISVEEYRSLVAGSMTEDELLMAVQTELNLGHWRWHHVRRSDAAISQGVSAGGALELDGEELRATNGDEVRPARVGAGQEDWIDAFAGVRRVRSGTWRPVDLDTIRRT